VTAVLQLESAAAEFYSDLRLAPFLRQLLVRSGELVGAVAGSVSLVDAGKQRYLKMAERGAPCRLGQSFPLDEGVTGQVVARRGPVVLDSYNQVAHGHLAANHPARDGAVAAIPIWWRGDVIGANVLFAGGPRDFTAQEVDDLEMLTQLAAPGIVRAGETDPTLSNLIRAQPRIGAPPAVTEVGTARPVAPSVAQVALDLVTLAERTAVPGDLRRPTTTQLHVAVVHRPTGLRLLVHNASATGSAVQSQWQELVDTAGGGVSFEHIPGWGSLLRADLPYAEPAPFTPREHQVLQLLGAGMSDKTVAQTLAISPKTVEKHVAGILRKTGSTSRTAAVLEALGRGWLTRS
jgi:DNA-binding CsgD family transcriptional regulator